MLYQLLSTGSYASPSEVAKRACDDHRCFLYLITKSWIFFKYCFNINFFKNIFLLVYFYIFFYEINIFLKMKNKN